MILKKSKKINRLEIISNLKILICLFTAALKKTKLELQKISILNEGKKLKNSTEGSKTAETKNVIIKILELIVHYYVFFFEKSF